MTTPPKSSKSSISSVSGALFDDLPIPEAPPTEPTVFEALSEVPDDVARARRIVRQHYLKTEQHRFQCEVRYWHAMFAQSFLQRKHYVASLYRHRAPEQVKNLLSAIDKLG